MYIGSILTTVWGEPETSDWSRPVRGPPEDDLGFAFPCGRLVPGRSRCNCQRNMERLRRRSPVLAGRGTIPEAILCDSRRRRTCNRNARNPRVETAHAILGCGRSFGQALPHDCDAVRPIQAAFSERGGQLLTALLSCASWYRTIRAASGSRRDAGDGKPHRSSYRGLCNSSFVPK